MSDRVVNFKYTGDTSDLDNAAARANATLKGSAAVGDKAGKAMAASSDKAREAQLELLELMGGPSKDAVAKFSTVLGGVNPVLLGVAAGAAGAAAGLAIFAGSIVSTVAESDELARSLMDIEGLDELDRFAISDETLASLDAANASMDTLAVVGDRAKVALAESFAPAVSGLSKGITFLGLAAADAWEYLSSGEVTFQSLGQAVVKGLTQFLLQPVTALEALTLAIANVAELAGFDELGAKARSAAEDVAAFTKSFGATSAAEGMENLSKAWTAGKAKARELAVETNTLTTTVGEHTEAGRDNKTSMKAQGDEAKALEKGLKALGDAQREATKAQEDAAKATETLVDRVDAIDKDPIEALRDEYADLNKEILKQIEANQAAGISTESLVETQAEAAVKYKEIIAEAEADVRAERQATADAAIAASAQAASEQQDLALNTAMVVLKAFADMADAFGSFAELMSAPILEALSSVQDRLANLQELQAELTETSVEASKLQGDALVEAYTSGEVAAEDLSDSQKAFLEAELAAKIDAAKKKEAIYREEALKAFNLQKAAAISSAIINGALAVIGTLAGSAMLGPIAQGVAVAGVTALSAANVATIAAQEPTFHTGGFVDSVVAGASQSRSNYAQDEVPAKLQTGEAVLSRQGRAMLGDDTIRRVNRGQSAGAPVVNTTVVYEGKIISQAVQDQLRTNGNLRRSVRRVSKS